MIFSERFFVGRESGLAGPECFGRIAFGEEQAREIVTPAIRIRGMLGAEHLLVDRQRALVERSRRRQIALGLKQEGEVVEARRRIGMLGAEHLLPDRQCALEERPRPRQVALVLKQARFAGEDEERRALSAGRAFFAGSDSWKGPLTRNGAIVEIIPLLPSTGIMYYGNRRPPFNRLAFRLR
jgi:hypothetical protein